MRYLNLQITTTTDSSEHEDERNTPLINEIKSLRRVLNDKKQIVKKETESICEIEGKLTGLLKKNVETPIKWKYAIKHCVEVDYAKSMYFLKSTTSIYACISKKYSVEITRDMKNKISTTLSMMHKTGDLGRCSYNGISYYGIPELFEENDMSKLKQEYEEFLPDLVEVTV